MNALSRARPAASDWWRDFFAPIAGEAMFAAKEEESQIEVDNIVRRTGVAPPAEVLDLACGTGRHSLVFAARGFAVTGLDYSAPFLREGRRNARKAGLRVRFVQGDMKDLGAHFADGRFDLVVALFNSFGYFTRRSDDTTMLRAVLCAYCGRAARSSSTRSTAPAWRGASSSR